MAEGDSLLPGFRFFPTDEELVAYYLRRKAFRGLSHDHVIGELDLYNFDPWDLPGLAVLKSRDGQWFFFAPRERRQLGMTRTSRATESGYWKTTGRDRKIRPHGCSQDAAAMGMKKTLVFYEGRAPHGARTDWVMHEYRIDQDYEKEKSVRSGFVVCKVFKKGGPGPRNGEQYGAPLLTADDNKEEREQEEEEEKKKGRIQTLHAEASETPSMANLPTSPPPPPPPPPIPTFKQEDDLLAFLLGPVPEELPADLVNLESQTRRSLAAEEAAVLAEMLQTANEMAVAEDAPKKGITDSPSCYYYYYYPPLGDFLELEDLMPSDMAAIPMESGGSGIRIGSPSTKIKLATQYQFLPPPPPPPPSPPLTRTPTSALNKPSRLETLQSLAGLPSYCFPIHRC